MLEILQFIFKSFAIWLGSIILITTLLNGTEAIIRTFMDGMNVRKHGWPPPEKKATITINRRKDDDATSGT